MVLSLLAVHFFNARRLCEKAQPHFHDHDVYVSTGGWIENLISTCPRHIDDYLAECKKLGFDMIELSTGFIQLPIPDLLRLIDKVKKAVMKPKPEIVQLECLCRGMGYEKHFLADYYPP